MIVIHIDTMADTAGLKKVYEGLDNVTLLYNPTYDDVCEELERNPDPLVMCLGHGTPNGLFGEGFWGNVVDGTMTDLLKDRKMIGIWCYASEFGKTYNLHGFFTSMFISNFGEALMMGYGFDDITDEEIFGETDLFCNKVNTFLRDGVPMDQWVGLLQAGCHKEKGYVKYNYDGLKYFE